MQKEMYIYVYCTYMYMYMYIHLAVDFNPSSLLSFSPSLLPPPSLPPSLPHHSHFHYSYHLPPQQCQARMGSTDIWRPLHALQLLSGLDPAHSSPDHTLSSSTSSLPPQSLFLVSDGHVTDEEATLTAIRQGLHHCRLFTFGVRFVWPVELVFHS